MPEADLANPMREVGALLDARAVHGGRSAYNHLICLAQTNGIGRRWRKGQAVAQWLMIAGARYGGRTRCV